jgi:uncharacterized SAM-binding protein YcdF (DUF218 family)
MISITTIILVCALLQYTLANNTNIIVVLGSSDNNILSERVTSTIEYIENNNSEYILYVSGGVKHAFTCDDTEASKMASQIISSTEDIKIVLDEQAKNTAENFAYLKKWMYSNFSENNLPNVIITTSDFHKTRAERIFKGILPDFEPVWNLSASHCTSCWGDERIHMRNVHTDIQRALYINAV